MNDADRQRYHDDMIRDHLYLRELSQQMAEATWPTDDGGNMQRLLFVERVQEEIFRIFVAGGPWVGLPKLKEAE